MSSSVELSSRSWFGGAEHTLSPQNAACSLQTAGGDNHIKHLCIMSGSGRTVDDELSEFGIATVGKIDSKLVEKVRDGSLDVWRRGIRQTVLRWNSDCNDIVNDFETVGDRPPKRHILS